MTGDNNSTVTDDEDISENGTQKQNNDKTSEKMKTRKIQNLNSL